MTVPIDASAVEAAQTVPVAVHLCEHLKEAGRGLDLVEIGQRLEGAAACVRARIIPALCDRPIDSSAAEGGGVDRLVLGLCREDFARLEMERSARKAGLDPLGIQTINLAGLCGAIHDSPASTEKASALLLAAVARARAFAGSLPEHVMPRFAPMDQHVSRRALLTMPPLRYRPVVTLDRSRCAADEGCRRCVQACPLEAIEYRNMRIVVDRNRCSACGLCVVDCPSDAFDLPADSPMMLAAELEALLVSPAPSLSEQRAPLFVGRANEQKLAAVGEHGTTYSAAWLPVVVPCTGTVTAATILGALAAGADAVGVIACGGACRFGQAQRVADTVDYCRELLDALDGQPDLVRLLPADEEGELARALGELPGGDADPSANHAEPRRTIPTATSEAVLALAQTRGTPENVRLEHAASPLGLVTIDTNTCTACGSCGSSCPTGALVFEECDDGDRGVALTFDAALCIGCGLCMGRCPENAQQAVSVQRVTDLTALQAGRITLHRDRVTRCELCGSAIGPAGMLRRIEELLGGDLNAAGIAAITRRCPACRGIGGSRVPGALRPE